MSDIPYINVVHTAFSDVTVSDEIASLLELGGTVGYPVWEQINEMSLRCHEQNCTLRHIKKPAFSGIARAAGIGRLNSP